MSDKYKSQLSITLYPSSSNNIFTGTWNGSSIVSPDFADGFAYDDAKKKITIFINENASIKFVKADVTVNLSDEYTSNGVSSIITASGSGSATSDGAVSSIFTMIDNAYNPACNAAKDSLSTHAGLLNHGVIHSQQVGAKPVGPKE
jgi:hypothetical protein